jgi:hypothetical protein
MTAPITEFTVPDGSRRRNVLLFVIVGLTVMAMLVLGAIFFFDPFASAAGSCGGG